MSIEETNGRVFECPSNVDGDVRIICGGGEYEVPLEFAKPPRILDIGANVGAFALWASRKWPGCMIDSYEPNPEAFAFLTKNVATFDLRVRAHALGVRNFAGRALLRRGINNGATNLCCGSFFDIGSQAADGVEVDIVHAGELPDCEVLKVDTEGAELEIIRAYFETPRVTPVAVVLLEAHSRSDRVLLEALLDEAGLELYCGQLRMPNLGTFAFVKRSVIAETMRAR